MKQNSQKRPLEPKNNTLEEFLEATKHIQDQMESDVVIVPEHMSDYEQKLEASMKNLNLTK